MLLNREMLFQKLKLKTETVNLDDDEIIVSEISATDLINIYSREDLKKGDTIDPAKFYPVLIAYSVIDEKGDRIFKDEDISILEKSGGKYYQELFKVARRLNGMDSDEIKNSESSQD
jgi:hypothetical protein